MGTLFRKGRITLEIEGTEEIEELIGKVYEQAGEMEKTIEKIRLVLLNVQARINQPPERTGG